jgi:acyl-coenzyme A thioesterase PaaI-like protein
MNDGASRLGHFYEAVGGRFEPTGLAVSPWDVKNQGGVPLGGLIAHLAEQAPAPVPMSTARVVIDILRPTPFAALESRVRVVREGRRMQVLDIELVAAETVTVRASVLRVRLADSPAAARMHVPEVPPLAGGRSLLLSRSRIAHIAETRLVVGGLDELGSGTAWFRLSGEIVQGHTISPFVQAVMAADFGSGLSTIVDWREWTFVNLDITVHLTRMPEVGWVKLDAETLSAGNGIALVDGRIADERGPLGRTHQTLFLERVKR